MDLGFLLSVIGLLAGVWLFLHRTILDLTVTSPTDRTLLFLGFMHCTVTNYLVLAFFVFFFKGTGGTSSAHIAAALPVVTAIILHTWPVVLICLVLGFLTGDGGQAMGDKAMGDRRKIPYQFVSSLVFVVGVLFVCPLQVGYFSSVPSKSVPSKSVPSKSVPSKSFVALLG